jgi:type IV pilus assembly protein PilW
MIRYLFNVKKICCKSKGFTLVELMVTVAISGFIIAAIYSAYISQQRTYLAQEQVAEMQQNIRAAIDMMAREIRMAGYDPTQSAGAGITAALAGQISFTLDNNDDDTIDNNGNGKDDEPDGDTGDPGEVVDFGFSTVAGSDANRDGIPDTVINGVPESLSLGRQTGGAGGYQPIAENIQAIEFRFLDKDNVVAALPADIRAVQISILARAEREDRDFTNTMTYTPASGVPWDLNGAALGNAPNDNFRRRLLITTVQCRNMGL